jgi:hypothetical protein
MLGSAMWLTWMLCVTTQFLSTAISLVCEIVAPFNFISQLWPCFVVLDDITNARSFAVVIPSLLFHPIFFSKGFSLVANLFAFAQGLKAAQILPKDMGPRRIVALYAEQGVGKERVFLHVRLLLALASAAWREAARASATADGAPRDA